MKTNEQIIKMILFTSCNVSPPAAVKHETLTLTFKGSFHPNHRHVFLTSGSADASDVTESRTALNCNFLVRWKVQLSSCFPPELSSTAHGLHRRLELAQSSSRERKFYQWERSVVWWRDTAGSWRVSSLKVNLLAFFFSQELSSTAHGLHQFAQSWSCDCTGGCIT